MDKRAAVEQQSLIVTQGLLADFFAESSVLLICFAPMGRTLSWRALDIPPFAFIKTTAAFAVKKIFVRDLQQVWYQLGIEGLGQNVDEVAESFKRMIRAQGVTKVVTIGASSGGYAALLFGWLLEADETHAFSPRTSLAWRRLLSCRDLRLPQQLASLYFGSSQKKYLDLQSLFAQRLVSTKFHLYYSQNYLLDVRHAQQVEHFPNVELHAYQEGNHQLAHWLKSNGQLSQIISAALGAEQPRVCGCER